MEADFVLAFYIYQIARLPPLPPLNLNDDERTLLSIHQIKYRALSLYLRWFRLAEKPPEQLFLLPEIHPYEPLARFWDSVLDLIIELYPRTGDELIRAFNSPAELWFACILLTSDDAFKQAFTGFPAFRFKREAIKNARDCLKFLNNIGEIAQLKLSSQRAESIKPVDPAKHRGGSLMAWILLNAAQHAATDSEFDRKCYRPFLRASKKVVGVADRSKGMQITWIDLERQLSTTKQNRKKSRPTKE